MTDLSLAAPCGLYCGICSTLLDGLCHGCGCLKDDCFAAEKHKICQIYRCTLKRKLKDCGECSDFPCTTLIQFTFDPIMRTHLPVIQNLIRRRKIGVEAWLKEQDEYWRKNPDKFREWIEFHRECKKRRAKT